MRPRTLRSAGTAFDRISEVTAKPKQRRRGKPPVRAEVIAIRGDEDWFVLFADENGLAPRAAMPAEPGPTRPERSQREAIGSESSKGEATGNFAHEAAPSVQLPELAWIGPDAPAWLRYALVRWHFGPWPVITGAAGIMLSAWFLVFAARSLGGPIRPAPADIKVASTSNESSLATTPPPTAPRTFVAADVRALLAPVAATNTPPPVRPVTRSDRAETSSRRTVALSQPARSPEGTRTRPTGAASVRPTATSTPIVTPIPAPMPMPAAASPQTGNDAAAERESPPPPAAPPVPTDSQLIRSLLDHYRQAYSSLDADAVAGVWPSVNTRSLARAFGQLESQRFEFTDCRINVSGAHAQAICTGKASFVPKIGGRSTRSENREWAFVLERLNAGWIISRAESR